jgi:hydrogenase-1 operon protein HyaF
MPLDAFAALRPGPGTLTDRLVEAGASAPETAAAVRAVLAAARDALAVAAASGTAVAVAIDGLDPAGLVLLGEVLGEGEVKAKVTLDDRLLRVQESVLPGLWRILDGDRQTLEAADVPSVLRDAVRALPLGVSLPGTLPEGAMNVGPVIGELDDATRVHEATGAEKEVNLTLMPMTPVDLLVLDMALGLGPVSIVSMGYGDCRILAGGRRHTWSVRFSNTEGREILHTVQAGDVPVAARATAEDMGDSIARLDEIMGSLFA